MYFYYMTGDKHRLCEVENKFLNEECSVEELLGDVSSKQKEKNNNVKDSMEEGCEKENLPPGRNSNRKRKSDPKKDSTQVHVSI